MRTEFTTKTPRHEAGSSNRQERQADAKTVIPTEGEARVEESLRSDAHVWAWSVERQA